MKAKILLVEDNEELNETNRRYLESAGYEVETAAFLAEARVKLIQMLPDVILLDVMLPDGDGIDFCQEIYGKTAAQVIFLTAKSGNDDLKKGLAAGGNVYLTKPYPMELMLSYVEREVQHKNSLIEKIPDVISYGGFSLSIRSGVAMWKGVDLILSAKELSILLLLVQHHDRAINDNSLYETIWKKPLIHDKNSLWRHISSLKQKITSVAGDKVEITFSRGSGYMLCILEG
jgi:DNA-binding response OmpR family regulator